MILVIIALLLEWGLLYSFRLISRQSLLYVAIAILAGMDSVFGGFAATINNNFK